MISKDVLIVIASLASFAGNVAQGKEPSAAGLDSIYPELDAFYIDLHQTPELSGHEEKTSAKLADRLRRLGYNVTTGVGGYGVVALMRNGNGPTLLLRTDMDALPVQEKTGLPYASKVTAPGKEGGTVGVMHACGHDIHMTSLIGTATLLAKMKDRWQGTLFLIGQPAEETAAGAEAMIKAGLFTKFPKPNFAIALHDTQLFPAGKIGYTPGYAAASLDTVSITIFGKGGHGAYPHLAVDPIVIAARTILSLQTIVARENNPLDPAVVTVGSIRGGTKSNIIPEEVNLQLTVRSYKEEVRKHLLSAIERIAKAEAASASAPKEPSVIVVPGESTSAVYNDPALTKRVVGVLSREFGDSNVTEVPPTMGSEDFSVYGRAGVPAVMFWLGAAEPQKFEKAKATGSSLPGLHSAEFAPDRERTIRTGVSALTAVALDLMGKTKTQGRHVTGP
jgi:hippurate hydrolase